MSMNVKANTSFGNCGRHAWVWLAAVVLSIGVWSSSANTVIVQDSFNYTGDLENVAGTTPDTANLPGGNWVSVVQWPWSQPTISGDARSWDWSFNKVNMNEEKASINISLAGYNTGRLRISADIAIPADRLTYEGVALGFKASVPYIGFTNVNYDTAIKANFSGIRVNGSGQIALIVNGTAQSSLESNIELVGGQFYPLSYDVDTASGDISNIKFNGVNMADFTTTAFSPAATANATYLVLVSSRGFVDNFSVTAIEGVMTPAVSNASGATAVVGTGASLNGILTSGNNADITIYWGTDPENWSNTNYLGTLPDGMFSKVLTGLPLSTTHYYRCFATNAVGGAWADGNSSFVSAAQIFTWTGSGGNANWTTLNNWNPNSRIPNLARETVCFSNGNATVYLNQSTVTIGGISMTPNNWSGAGFNITTNAPGQKLVFDYGDGPAFIRTFNSRWANSTISAPIVLSNDVEVTTSTAGTQYGLILRGPITGPGKIIAKNALIFLNPLQNTTYHNTFSGTKSSGYLTKSGTKTATLTGTNSIAFAGGWDDASGIVLGGGKLVLSGGIFTNQTASTRAVYFRDAGNALIVTNGARLINARSGNGAYYNKAGNEIVVTGEGSLWDLHGDSVFIDASSNRFTIANGGHVMNAQGRIGWTGGSYNTVLVTGNSTLWNVGGSMSVGRNSVFNTLTITDGAVVENTWLWLGGYAYYEDGASSDTGLIITNGGKLNSGKDDGWGWGSCVGVGGVSGGRVDRNYALVSGAGSTWDLINRPLRIGYVTKTGAKGAWNRIQVEAGGMITNVNTLYVGCTAETGVSSSNNLIVAEGGAVAASSVVVGSATSLGNMLTLGGGEIRAASLSVTAGNKLSPVLSSEGLMPMTVSGTATFADGSYVSPSKTDDVSGSASGVVLTAASVVDNGLELDPALSPDNWKITVTSTRIEIRYSEPCTIMVVR